MAAVDRIADGHVVKADFCHGEPVSNPERQLSAMCALVPPCQCSADQQHEHQYQIGVFVGCMAQQGGADRFDEVTQRVQPNNVQTNWQAVGSVNDRADEEQHGDDAVDEVFDVSEAGPQQAQQIQHPEKVQHHQDKTWDDQPSIGVNGRLEVQHDPDDDDEVVQQVDQVSRQVARDEEPGRNGDVADHGGLPHKSTGSIDDDAGDELPDDKTHRERGYEGAHVFLEQACPNQRQAEHTQQVGECWPERT